MVMVLVTVMNKNINMTLTTIYTMLTMTTTAFTTMILTTKSRRKNKENNIREILIRFVGYWCFYPHIERLSNLLYAGLYTKKCCLKYMLQYLLYKCSLKFLFPSNKSCGTY